MEKEQVQFKETIQEQQGRQVRRAFMLSLARLSKLQMRVMMRRPSPRTEEPELERPGIQDESCEELPELPEPVESPSEGRPQGMERLQRRCAELEQLLREHAVQLATAPAQQMQAAQSHPHANWIGRRRPPGSWSPWSLWAVTSRSAARCGSAAAATC